MVDLRPRPATALAKTIQRVRTRGFGEIAELLSGRAREVLDSRGELIVLCRAAEGSAPLRDDFSFRRASVGDGPAFGRDIGTDSAATFARRLERPGVSCYLVFDEGHRIVHSSWVTTTAAWTRELGVYMAPPAGAAYIYESFTRPEVRGRGIYPFALHSICAHLHAEGIREAWIGVEATNAPSVRAIGKGGFEEAFRITFGRRRGRIWRGTPHGPLSERAPEIVLPLRENTDDNGPQGDGLVPGSGA